MYRFILSLSAALMLILPSVAWAGGPNADSPEPSFWMFLFLGALPLGWHLYKQHSNSHAKASVSSQNDR